MALVTGYAVYFGGERSAPSVQDGVSGGSLTLDFDPSFAKQHSRGMVTFPQTGKREGGFFSFDGVFYFVPDNPTGLPTEYEGRVTLLECRAGSEKPAAKKAEKPKAVALPARKKRLPEGAVFYDMPELEASAEPETPDMALKQSLKTMFEEPEALEEARAFLDAAPVPEEVPPLVLDEAIEQVAAAPEAEPVPVLMQSLAPVEEETSAEPAKPLVLFEPDEGDDWAVYLQPQPEIQLNLIQTRIVEVVHVTAEQRHVAQDDAIDLVLVGGEKETFQTFAREVVETVDSFEELKKLDQKEVEEEPLLSAELAKLDPGLPDKRPMKLLPWIKRNETEEEMLERLTIKSARYAG